ncbi:MAG: hypothetical protein H8D23_11135 [Candidatus Brocadiales bacterium]|nr:hypothetical protein [Candidatus Brocadiales bacterium]
MEDCTRCATHEHRSMVAALLMKVAKQLLQRAEDHDKSKLESPEVEIFDEFTPKLKGTTYDSPEYKQYLGEMGEALNHHYFNNRHHPEYHDHGIKDMNLIDLIEMICDWKAATTRHADGDISRSVELNQERFGYTNELKQIFINTVKELK